MPVTRLDLDRAKSYSKCVEEVNKRKHELQLLEEHQSLLFESMSQNAQNSQVAVAPKFWHAEVSRSRSEKLLQSRVYKIGTINRQKCPLEKLGEVP